MLSNLIHNLIKISQNLNRFNQFDFNFLKEKKFVNDISLVPHNTNYLSKPIDIKNQFQPIFEVINYQSMDWRKNKNKLIQIVVRKKIVVLITTSIASLFVYWIMKKIKELLEEAIRKNPNMSQKTYMIIRYIYVTDFGR